MDMVMPDLLLIPVVFIFLFATAPAKASYRKIAFGVKPIAAVFIRDRFTPRARTCLVIAEKVPGILIK
jgi:hypothetical protein